MEIDKVTCNDLSVFQAEEDQTSVFETLNFTRTIGGKEQLRYLFEHPFATIEKITATQEVVKFLGRHLQEWPGDITNGTIMVMEKFYATAVDTLPANPNFLNAASYKLLHSSDFSLVKFSITHFADFFRGVRKLNALFAADEAPPLLKLKLQRMNALLQNHRQLAALAEIKAGEKLSLAETLRFGHFLKGRFKQECFDMIDTYSLLDAWCSMSIAGDKLDLVFPEFVSSEGPVFDALQLYHPLLPTPVAYDVELKQGKNFLFLTGANMAGKSTYIKAVGIAVFLAHIGMGVPAAQARMSIFDGLLSNIQVVDNISKGESYFFNEVQRIRNTVEKINNGKKWLVLIDELFKGTNVQDAMKCSLTVIKGLIKIHNSLFILSTHLYEIGEELTVHPNIIFRYFETFAHNDQLEFSYVLKEGISNDRLGYLILKREGVVAMLEKL
jgi:DNA mismatch repair ATPase MutS